jgi:hypothetical protein
MAAVKELTALFKAERMVYLIATTSALIMLLASGGWLLLKSKADPAALTLMFGSSGLITYSANRLLRMWDYALRVLLPTQGAEEKDK